MNAIPVYFPTALHIPRHNIFRRIFAFLSAAVHDFAIPSAVRQSQYDEAIRCYGRMMDRICFGYAKTGSDFDDLKQDVRMNLWTSLPKFKGDCSMKAWVYRLTLNVCVSTLRKSYRKIHTVQLDELYDMVECEPDRMALIAELHEAIGALNPLDKAIMLLWLEEESYDDIADITGLTRANVATRIHRAKKRLKSIITL